MSDCNSDGLDVTRKHFSDDNRNKFLLKFGQKEHIKEFLEKGEIHFSSINFFRNLSYTEGDPFIGDPSEGSLHYEFSANNIITSFQIGGRSLDIKQLKDSGASIQLNLRRPVMDHWGICSFFALPCDELILHEQDHTLSLSPAVVDTFKRFMPENYSCLVFYDPNKFFDKLCLKSNIKDLPPCTHIRRAPVRYSDSNQKTLQEFQQYFNQIPDEDLAFYKTQNYANQEEYRLTIDTDISDEKGCEIHVGDLSDCAMIIDDFSKADIHWNLKSQDIT
ncbi:hypothetical protein [Oenococcus sicerae]|uniref:Uncharacterized protein n=1 Tax=Oenococcus sicerae TaxID=2203724 RepID=A0AAJ1R9H4_9LACO|nr:hypothetical protein [Oenococcus sicerae]MDN6900659.1 hypothetical protein [Oenococcus sicerae]